VGVKKKSKWKYVFVTIEMLIYFFFDIFFIPPQQKHISAKRAFWGKNILMHMK